MDKRLKKIITISAIILAMIIILLTIRFILGGSEDSWICSAGEWIKHGNPSAPMPLEKC